jgi:hypothetical protein
MKIVRRNLSFREQKAGNITKARITSLWFNERAFIFTKTSKLPSGGVPTVRVFRSSNPEQPVRIHSLDPKLILPVLWIFESK